MSDEALSLDGAAAALAAAREPEQAEQPAEAAPEAEIPSEAPAEVVEPEEQETETDAPAEEQADVEVDTETEPETPAIDPPVSWTKADKELFATLPPEAQQVIAQREKARDTEVNRTQQEIAAERKAIAEREAQISTIEQEKRTLEDLLLAKLPPEPNPALIDTNPTEYMRQKAHFDRAIGELQGIVARRAEAEAKQAREIEAQEAEHRKAQAAELEKLIPELKGENGRQIASDIVSYGKAQGYDDATLGIANANDLHVLFKAMKWDRAQEAARAAKAKPIPKVSPPGVARTKAEQGADQRRSVLQKLNSSGSIEDAVAAYQALRG